MASPGDARIRFARLTRARLRERGLLDARSNELEQLARESGAPAARLDTNRSLVEAIRMYRSSGYTETRPFNDEPFAHHWFIKALA